MRLLLLTQVLPYPPDAGPKVKIWHVLRHLVEAGHEVVLGTFLRPSERPHLPAVQALCREVHAVPIQRSRLTDLGYWLRSQLRGRPFLVERDARTAMFSLVRRVLAQGWIDGVHADQVSMAQFALAAEGAPLRVFDAHNAVWLLLERMAAVASPAMRPWLRLEAARMKRYEGALVRAFDHTLVVSEADRQAMEEAAWAVAGESPSGDGRLSVIPIAIDTEQVRPVERMASQTILTVGTLHYPPNADGIRWFLAEVFPKVVERSPQARLVVVGKNPPADLVALADQFDGRVEVTGYVPDLKPYLRQAALMVVPVRAGGGMRVRLLEAFAWQVPTVTTTAGLEGIDATPGEHLLVGDTPEAFAEAVLRLLADRKLAEDLATAGRRLVEARYDRRRVLRRLEEIYRAREVREGAPQIHA